MQPTTCEFSDSLVAKHKRGVTQADAWNVAKARVRLGTARIAKALVTDDDRLWLKAATDVADRPPLVDASRGSERAVAAPLSAR